ncbi:MAG: hypothetical protein KGJ97_05760 [Xanthomonadaceae bacterium]|jgi:vitamin B12 transport system permease protein|nr:hypothetical protein [Xanthomonadaceae bacterium]MDE3071562.1 hypothetical protein [Pseudomonadota bacterium]
MSARPLLKIAFAAFSAAMLGLAAGALWMVATLYLRQLLPWLAVPVGALLAWTIRQVVLRPGIGAAVLAALATALAALYMNLLLAATRIAGEMGMGLIDAMRTAGAGMLWQLARLALTPVAAGWFVTGIVLAAAIAARPPRPHLPPPARP